MYVYDFALSLDGIFVELFPHTHSLSLCLSLWLILCIRWVVGNGNMFGGFTVSVPR